MENGIINEHKEYLSNNYGIKLHSKMETSSLIYGFLTRIKIQLCQDLSGSHQKH